MYREEVLTIQLNHSAKLAKCLSVFIYKLSDCGFESHYYKMSLPNRVLCVTASSACSCSNLLKTRQFLIFACERANLPINMPACQCAKGMLSFQLRLPKAVPVFQLLFKIIFHFLNISIMLNSCKFQKYLGNYRKFISPNKQFKFCCLQNFIKEKPYQAKTFGVFFNGAHGVNQTIIWLA